jgi:hypothetical protein
MGVSCRGSRRRVVGLAVVAGLLVVLLVGVVPGHLAEASRGGLLFLLPAFLLACVLFAKRYPGERVIERLRLARGGRRPRRESSASRPRLRLCVPQRGGRLIAVSLAGRAPPLLAGCC